MLKAIGQQFGTALEGIPIIGDSLRDIDAANSVSARPLLVLTGNGMATAAALEAAGRQVDTFVDLADAASALIAEQDGFG